MKKRLALIGVLVVVLAGCSDDKTEPLLDVSPERPKTLFAQAQTAFDAGQYKTASKNADELVRVYPYAVQAPDALLLSADALYRNNEPESAQPTYKRFVMTFPGHPRAAYAQYMAAVCLYDRLSDPARDTALTLETEALFKALIKKYPDGDYAEDARMKLVAVRDHLAAHEMEVGRYYLRKNNAAAALQRFRTVTLQFQDTAQVQEALHRTVEASLLLGLREEALRAAAVLGKNYPDSRWYADSYALLQGAR